MFTDDGPAGAWAANRLAGATLIAPAVLPFQVANVLRRLELTKAIDRTTAAQAHRDLLDLRVALCPYLPLAPRVWELRDSLTGYDASYVALGEFIDAPVVTIDGRLSKAHGPRCVIEAYPDRP